MSIEGAGRHCAEMTGDAQDGAPTQPFAAPAVLGRYTRLGQLALCAVLAFALALSAGYNTTAGSEGGLLRGAQHKAHTASRSAFVDAFDATALLADSLLTSASAEVCASQLPELQREFVSIVISAMYPYSLGDVDSAALVPFLLRFYAGTPRPLIVDVGANIGDSSDALMELLCAPDGELFVVRPKSGSLRAGGSSVQGAACAGASEEALRGGRMLAYEPQRQNFEVLDALGKKRGWGGAGWRAFEMALVAPEQAPSAYEPVLVKFFSNGVAGDQQAGLAANSSYVTEVRSQALKRVLV
jgi:hypothetical protein